MALRTRLRTTVSSACDRPRTCIAAGDLDDDAQAFGFGAIAHCGAGVEQHLAQVERLGADERPALYDSVDAVVATISSTAATMRSIAPPLRRREFGFDA